MDLKIVIARILVSSDMSKGIIIMLDIKRKKILVKYFAIPFTYDIIYVKGMIKWHRFIMEGDMYILFNIT